ncbi:large conductance mechanosensitive channel protein MscL [Leucobacter insecticola]|uniref:Large-conductance mechanosensitive channel n=1 Tax=Leucobacter insecticola TaxID=2714934 RepID=A0A6G8FIZ6_9MICO|nr:large conductance mechanosensitive channel protein MscL [Leucobacter insecticola]QIM16334.1 large conductance mechanosensitive channel protein MscL [Leucobacter insecticola]
MFKGFKEFLLRGNVIDLAVAVVIGAAFNAVVQKVVDALINPVVGMVFKADSLDGAMVVGLPGGGAIAFGALLGAVLNFVIVAAVVYFVFVLPMNRLRGPAVAEEPAPAGPSEHELLTEIRDLLRAQATAGRAGDARGSEDPPLPSEPQH